MKTYWPDYYRKFRCLADRCRHTCCEGWEIEIDDVSLERFWRNKEVSGKISDGCFILKDDGRCPFLLENNLCDMIIKHGGDYLCDICKEHPRFYNVFDDHVEAGIGLVCEEACRLVLEAEKPFTLYSEDGSKMPLPEYVSRIFDASTPFDQILKILTGGRRTDSEIRAGIFAQMEVMDPEWSALLSKIIKEPVSQEDEDRIIEENAHALQNFAAYLLYRYEGAGRFAAEAVYLLTDLILTGCSLNDAARMFSGEVEYSDINIDEALETFGDT